MTRRRFYAPPEAFKENSVILSPDEARHLREVLRLKAGDEVFVFDGQGVEYSCTVVEPGRGNGTASLEVRGEVEPARPESLLRLTLALSLLKGDKFDLVVQKATELGVDKIVPVMCARSDVRLRDADDGLKRVARWQRLALEASKQSGRARLPQVHAPTTFSNLMELDSEQTRIMFSERDGGSDLNALKLEEEKPPAITALVGPEGGWEDDEISLAASAGWSVITLGGRTLRAETAAIAGVVLLQHLFGDLK